MGKKKVYSDLKDLSGLISKEEREQLDAKEEYQAKWRDNKFLFREMVAKKNRAWIIKESNKSSFEHYEDHPEVYDKIVEMFDQENKRKWLIHILTNFIPLNKASQVPKMPSTVTKCCLSGHELTDMKSILVGDRDKHIGFTGEKTDIILSGIALQELYRYVIDRTEDFNSRQGQIVNHAFDGVRRRSTSKNKKR